MRATRASHLRAVHYLGAGQLASGPLCTVHARYACQPRACRTYCAPCGAPQVRAATDWPRLAGAWGSLWHDLALKRACRAPVYRVVHRRQQQQIDKSKRRGDGLGSANFVGEVEDASQLADVKLWEQGDAAMYSQVRREVAQ